MTNESFHRNFGFIDNPRQLLDQEAASFDEYGEQTNQIYSRPLEGKGFFKRTHGYVDLLPSFRGHDFIDLVNKEIIRRENTHKPGEDIEPIVIIDAGYGSGQALLDMRKKWGKKVMLIGYGTDFHANINPKNREEIDNADIHLVNGRLSQIGKRVAERFGDHFKADFILMCNVMQYVKYPRYELLKKFYRVLRTPEASQLGGTFLSDYYPPLRYFDAILQKWTSLFDTLTHQRYAFAFDSDEHTLAFRKTHEDLPVDIRTAQVTSLEKTRFISTIRHGELPKNS